MFVVFSGLGLGLTATKYIAELKSKEPLRLGRLLMLTEYFAIGGAILTAIPLLIFSDYIASLYFYNLPN